MLSILFCSLDSFLASLGIGLIESSAINRRRFIAAFALCDWLGTLVGAAVRLGTPHLRPGGLGLTLASLFFGGIAVAVMASSKRFRGIVFEPHCCSYLCEDNTRPCSLRRPVGSLRGTSWLAGGGRHRLVHADGRLGIHTQHVWGRDVARVAGTCGRRGRKRLCHHGERRIPAGSREHDPGLQWRHRLRGGHRSLEVSKDRDGASFFDTR